MALPAPASAAGSHAGSGPAAAVAPAAVTPHLNPTLLADEQSASAAANSSGKPVVVNAETDTGTLLTANANGSYTLTESSDPVRTLQNGAWVPIDPTLSAQGGMVRPKATSTGVAFSDGGTAPMATLTQGTDSLSFSFPGTLPVPTLSGPTATYPDVLPGVDLQLTANAGGFSELLIVRTPAAAANPELKTLTLRVKSAGIQLADTADGGAQATDASGATVFHTDTATMWDASGATAARAKTAAPAADATGAQAEAFDALAAANGPADGSHLAQVQVHTTATSETLVPDASLLTSPTAKYPIVIDPAWSGNPSQLHWGRVSTNGWNIYDSTSTADGDNPRCGLDPAGDGETARTYYQMNTGGTTGTTGIGGADVTAATLYVNNAWSADSAATYADLYLTGQPANNGWNATDLNWSNKPGDGALQDKQSSYEASNGTVSPGTLAFNVLGSAQSAAANNWPNVTYDLRADDESNSLEWKQFQSGGGATISITYYRWPTLVNGTGDPATTPSTTDVGSTFVTSTNVTMKITSVDTDGENVRNGYEIWNWVNGAATTNVANSMFSDYTVNGGPYTYGGSSLTSGNTYAWRASSENPEGLWSPWSAWQVFTVDTTVPTVPSVLSTQYPGWSYGAQFGTAGTFTFTNDQSGIDKGYMFSVDGDMGNAVYNPASPPPTWTGSGTPTPGKIYWLEADNGNGTGAEVVNGFANAQITPNAVGPHTIYAKAVDRAGNSSNESTYLFFAGLTKPSFVYGDQLVNGYTAADGTVVPAATATVSNKAQLTVQSGCCHMYWADGSQAFLANGSGAVAVGDTAKMNFDVPTAGYWDIGAMLTQAPDYGQFSLVLDKSSTDPVTLATFDGYHSAVSGTYRDFGFPTDASGNKISLTKGLHTLTLTVTGKETAATGYQAGIGAIRLAPTSPTCAINNLTACLNNTSISIDTSSPFSPADSDGYNSAFSSTDLTAAGWTPGAPITVDGAPMTIPNYAANQPDNIVAGGQLVTVPSSGVANDGDAVVFLGWGSDGNIDNASGTITYASKCNNTTTQPYVIDTMPDWIEGSSDDRAYFFPRRVQQGSTYESTQLPQLFAVSVPLTCPGVPLASVSLPVVSNGVAAATPSLHILGLGIRPTAFASTANTQLWVGSFGARQDTIEGTWTNQTLRLPVRLTAGDSTTGGQVRIHLSNTLGTTPVKFTAVTIAPQSTATGAGPADAAATPTPVLFGGQPSVTIPAGGSIVSDPTTVSFPDMSTVLVSMALNGSVPNVPAHGSPQTNAYATPVGTADSTGATSGSGFTVSMGFQPYLTGIDVTSPGDTGGSLVLFGDHTINSDTAGGDGARLSDQITSQLAAANNNVVPYGVLNEGMNNWNTSNNLLQTVTNAAQPTNALGLADSNILNQAGVRTVLISSGTDDILAGTSYSQIENRLIAFSSEIQHYYTDASADLSISTSNGQGLITVYVATIPPDARFTPAEETIRETVNNFILCGINSPTAGTCTGNNTDPLSGHSNGAIDFAAAVSTGGNDTSPTIATADLSTGNPDNSYFAALAAEYIKDSATAPVQPMIAHGPRPLEN